MLLAARAAIHRPPREPLHHSVQREFGEMVQLCRSAYEDGPRLQLGDIILGWEYRNHEPIYRNDLLRPKGFSPQRLLCDLVYESQSSSSQRMLFHQYKSKTVKTPVAL